MKSHFAYIRVSTTKQGTTGCSLQEQREAINAYARRSGLTITAWFEEMETAAKLGRRAFNRMLSELEQGRANGVIIHKIDRSARNLKDWAHLGELMDRGVEVRFAHDNLDLATRGGRLSADIQAVVAADFIRNLREETRKGMRGRLKQGFYPFAAPIGYLNCGRAKAKEIDPVKGPLVKQLFELYGSGNYSLEAVRQELAARGLRTAAGKPLSLANIARLLHNPFYIGLMRVGTTGELFLGTHVPLVPMSLFDRVQAILEGRLYPRVQIHTYRFRRLIKCGACGRSLTGERQKGHVYYRCHRRACRGVSIAERMVEERIRRDLRLLRVEDGEMGELREWIAEEIAAEDAGRGERLAGIERDLGLTNERMARLTDALLDGVIDKPTFEERKAAILARRLELHERRECDPGASFWKRVAEKFELGISALNQYEIANDDGKRHILSQLGSNLVAEGKDVLFPMYSPFQEMRDWSISTECDLRRGAVRTLRRNSIQTLLSGLTDASTRAEEGRVVE